MIKQNKAIQSKIKPRLIDASRLYTYTAYAEYIHKSRQQLYNDINNGKIPAENIVEINGGSLILADRN